MEINQINEITLKIPLFIAADMGNNEIIDLLILAGRLEDAEDAYKSAVGMSSGNKVVLIKLAGLYIQKGEGDQVIGLLETAASNNPKSALLANNLAYLYLEKDENVNKAFALARFSYEHMPDDPGVVDSFGWAYYKKNIFAQAVNHLKYALVLSPGNEVVVGHLALAEKAMEKE